MARISLLTAHNGVGLSSTSSIIASVLAGHGHRVDVHPYGATPVRGYDAVVFLERIVPEWLECGPVRLWVPNQEWVDDRYLAHLDAIDVVLCKTSYAAHLFEALDCETRFIGFTSRDRLLHRVRAEPLRFLHTAGRSLQKGTGPLVGAWGANPGWPSLVLLQHPENRVEVEAENLDYIPEFVSDRRLRILQNRCGVHIFPSQAEGFGHSLVEAASCGALVATTDAPPMNELIEPDRGVLIPPASSQPQGLGRNFLVDRAGIEQAVWEVLEMSPARRRTLGANARRWFESNDRRFRGRLPAVIEDLLPTAGVATA